MVHASHKCIYVFLPPIPLLALLIAMAPAAVQGAFSLISLKPIDKGFRDKIRSERLKNTCYAWREDGPLLERYKELVK